MAGRDDLAGKSIQNLTKYYLCSDHFASDAFIDANVEDKSFLRLNKLYSIPLPDKELFENNLMKNVKSVTRNPQKFVTYTKHSTTEKSPRKVKVKEEKPVAIEDNIEAEYIDESLEVSLAAENDSLLCRLCAASSSHELLSIFNEQGELYSDTECLRLMPPGLIEKDDGLPQFVCFPCLEKLQACSNVIDGFISNQNLFSSAQNNLFS